MRLTLRQFNAVIVALNVIYLAVIGLIVLASAHG
jgi:hypothetical protein